jgi:hypothetical protein
VRDYVLRCDTNTLKLHRRIGETLEVKRAVSRELLKVGHVLFSLVSTARQGLKGNLNRLGIGRGLECGNADHASGGTYAGRSCSPEGRETAPHARQGTGEPTRAVFQILGIRTELTKGILSLVRVAHNDNAKRPLIARHYNPRLALNSFMYSQKARYSAAVMRRTSPGVMR